MQKIVFDVQTGQTQILELTADEIAALPAPQPPVYTTYPTETILQDRITGEPVMVFVENSTVQSEPIADA